MPNKTTRVLCQRFYSTLGTANAGLLNEEHVQLFHDDSLSSLREYLVRRCNWPNVVSTGGKG